jgi:hypothetical protein
MVAFLNNELPLTGVPTISDNSYSARIALIS